MTPEECVMIVGFVQEACPAQKFSEYTPDVWIELMRDLDFTDSRAACVNLGKRLTFIGPPEIRDEVTRIRAARLRAVDSGQLEPHDIDPNDVSAYLAGIRARREAVAAGQPVTVEQIESVKRPVEQLMQSAVDKLPKMPPALPQADLAKKRVSP